MPHAIWFKTQGSPGPATPQLVQMMTSSANCFGLGIAGGDDFNYTLPNPVGAGNCIVFKYAWPHNFPTPVISDNNGNTWPSPAITVDTGTSSDGTDLALSVWVLPNANAGKTKFNIHHGTAVWVGSYAIYEFCNIATSSPVNGTSSAARITGTSLAPGSFTPTTNNNANGGNLIMSFADIATKATANPTSWSPGSGFSLLDGDIAWTDNIGHPKAAQSFVQTTQAAINPTLTSTGDSTNLYNVIGIAMKVANAGTPRPNQMWINKLIHFTSNGPPATYVLQTPTTGNLLVFTNGQGGFTGITDTDSATWTKVTETLCQMFYSVNRSASPNLKLTIANGGGASPTSMRLYDISGADPNPFDSSGTASITPVGSVVTNEPTWTSGITKGMAIAQLIQGTGPCLSCTAPTGNVFDVNLYTGEIDIDQYENADGLAHVYFTSNPGTVNFSWTTANNTSGSVIGATFKSA